jgi:single-strand DNA-binding protein
VPDTDIPLRLGRFSTGIVKGARLVSEQNLVVLRGVLAAEGTQRDLPAGGTVRQFDVTTRDDDGAQTVPVAWIDPPLDGLPVALGEGIVVVGKVARRFFRAGGATQSRTEVVADEVIAASNRRRVGRVLGSVRRLVEGTASTG